MRAVVLPECRWHSGRPERLYRDVQAGQLIRDDSVSEKRQRLVGVTGRSRCFRRMSGGRPFRLRATPWASRMYAKHSFAPANGQPGRAALDLRVEQDAQLASVAGKHIRDDSVSEKR